METNANSEALNFNSEDLKVTFGLTERKHSYEETDINTTYGITASFTDLSGKHFEKSVYDISEMKEIVEEIIFRLKNEKVSFFHFESVIEDILFDQIII